VQDDQPIHEAGGQVQIVQRDQYRHRAFSGEGQGALEGRAGMYRWDRGPRPRTGVARAVHGILAFELMLFNIAWGGWRWR
jgi:hypothetical protein